MYFFSQLWLPCVVTAALVHCAARGEGGRGGRVVAGEGGWCRPRQMDGGPISRAMMGRCCGERPHSAAARYPPSYLIMAARMCKWDMATNHTQARQQYLRSRIPLAERAVYSFWLLAASAISGIVTLRYSGLTNRTQ